MKAKSLYGPWSAVRASDLNRLLRPFQVRLIVKKSREWGECVSVTAHAIEPPASQPTEAGDANGN